jgi:hypothetical protein
VSLGVGKIKLNWQNNPLGGRTGPLLVGFQPEHTGLSPSQLDPESIEHQTRSVVVTWQSAFFYEHSDWRRTKNAHKDTTTFLSR